MAGWISHQHGFHVGPGLKNILDIDFPLSYPGRLCLLSPVYLTLHAEFSSA